MTGAISIHIGVNRVDPAHYGCEHRLFGCVNDAWAMHAVAKGAGLDARPPLLDEEATAANVRQALKTAAAELAPGGLLVLTYAGHGTRLLDVDEPALGSLQDWEPDGHDEAWCLFDRMMRDDEVCGLLKGFKAGQRVLSVLDSCHSGAALEGMDELRVREIGFRAAEEIRAAHADTYMLEGIELGRRKEVQATVLLLAACDEASTTPDGKEHGAFTEALLQVLGEGQVESYDELHQLVAERHPARSPVLHPRNERTAHFRRERPFQIYADENGPPAPL